MNKKSTPLGDIVRNIKVNTGLVIGLAVILVIAAYVYIPAVKQELGAKPSEAFDAFDLGGSLPGESTIPFSNDPDIGWTDFIALTDGPEIERAEDIHGNKFVFATGTNDSDDEWSIIWNLQKAFLYNLNNDVVTSLPKEGGEFDYLYSFGLEGNIAYWHQSGAGNLNQIYKSDGVTTIPIPTDNQGKDHFSTDGDKLLYFSMESKNIIVRSVSGELIETIPLQGGDFANGQCLHISGNRVIWCESVNYGPADLWMYDISSTLPPVNLTGEDSASVFRARIDGNKIVYPTYKSGESGIKIYSYDISDSVYTQIAQTNLGLADINISGNDVVYISMVYPHQEVHLVDISKTNPMLYDQKIKTIDVPTNGIELYNAFLTRSSLWPWSGKLTIVFTAFVYGTEYKDSNIYMIKQL